MARPRTISDERLLAAAGQATAELGPGFTLADVAARAEVSVGTVAGRFGSKSGLLREMMRAAGRDAVARMRAEAGADGGGVAGLRAALLGWFADLEDADEAANHVAALGVDLSDPVLRGMLGELLAAVEKEVRALVRDAELPGAPAPARAARVLVGLVHGGVLDWSIAPRGRLRSRLAGDLDAVLDAWKQSWSTVDG